jgi:hypothetical protein
MDFSTGIASLQGLANLVGLLVNERDSQKAAAIQIEFSNKLIEAQAHLAQLLGTVIDQQGRIGALEQRVRDMEAVQAEKERYVLAKVGTEREFFAYALRDAAELKERRTEVAHFACQPCFELGKKVVLSGNGSGYWECPACKHGAQTGVTSFGGVGGQTRSRRDLLAGY